MSTSITAVVGAQYGSEGKGAVVYQLALDYGVHVRTGGPNAGHTIYHMGQKWAMLSVPCGWVNPNAYLVIGPGAVVNPEILADEVMQLEAAGYEIANRLIVDPRAMVISETTAALEGFTSGSMHKEIGSTGKGVGLARVGKIARGCWPGADVWLNTEQPIGEDGAGLAGVGLERCAQDSDRFVNRAGRVLLEGTQGFMLSLNHGIWPFVTSADCTAAALCSDAGANPMNLGQVIAVARTYPIRVAGNSGPLPNEITWDQVGPNGVEPERTTVTGKIRRVARWHDETVRRACRVNGATEVALTFVDYEFPILGNALQKRAVYELSGEYIDDKEREIRCPITMVGTGPASLVQL